jgi:hypothetical protein
LQGFERLDSFTHAGAADGQFFSQVLFGGQAFAGFHVSVLDQIEDVLDDLGRDGLSANQAGTLQIVCTA